MESNNNNKETDSHTSEDSLLLYQAPRMEMHALKEVIQGGVGNMAESEGAFETS